MLTEPGAARKEPPGFPRDEQDTLTQDRRPIPRESVCSEPYGDANDGEEDS